MRKAKHCYDCALWAGEDDDGKPILPCKAGHRPRFYPPKGVHDCDWGFKRRCEDFCHVVGVMMWAHGSTNTEVAP